MTVAFHSGRAVLLLILMGGCSAAFGVPVAQREFDQVLKRAPDAARGAQIYETCAACHGRRGEGVSDGTVPRLAGQSFNVIAKQIVDFRTGQRGDARMVHFTDTQHLAFSQPIADVAAYIASFPAPPLKAVVSSTSHAATQYSRLCERCHRRAGEGVEDTLTPRLASQHPDYLVRQLDDAVAGRRPPMAEPHTVLVRGISRDELVAIAAYVAAMGGD